MAEEVGIVQYDRSGNRLEFFGKTVIRVPTTDGGTKDFVISESGSSAKVASGSFTGNGGAVTVNHGLGVVPDLFLITCLSAPGTIPSFKFLNNWCGISEAFKNAYSFQRRQWGTLFSTVSLGYRENESSKVPIESDDDSYLNNANDQSITVGKTSGDGSTFKGNYIWLAIGGLT